MNTETNKDKRNAEYMASIGVLEMIGVLREARSGLVVYGGEATADTVKRIEAILNVLEHPVKYTWKPGIGIFCWQCGSLEEDHIGSDKLCPYPEVTNDEIATREM